MGESEQAGSVATAIRELGSPPAKKTIKQGRFASYVDTIKVGLRKISNYNKESSSGSRRREPVGPPVAQRETGEPTAVKDERRRAGGIIVGVKRKKDRGESNNEGSYSKMKTSFEVFLSTLPKLDPVHRTVVWVHEQPVEKIEEHKSLSSLPQRGRIVPLTQPPVTRLSSAYSYETSLSLCESERGTHGRGTPPIMDMGQPRIDDLFRKLHVRQEHQARKEMARQGEYHLSSRNLRDIDSVQILGYPPGVTPELLPFLSHIHSMREPSILHKDSFYYQQTGAPPTIRCESLLLSYWCEWDSCTVKFSTSRELFEHVHNEHIASLPSYLSKYKVRSSRGHYQLVCRWKGCWDSFDDRYKLLLHLQNCHFKKQKVTTTKIEEEYFSRLEPDSLSPPTIGLTRESKYLTYPSSRPLQTQHHPTSTEPNSLQMTNYPVLKRQDHPQSKRRRVAYHRATVHTLPLERTPHSKYRPGGR